MLFRTGFVGRQVVGSSGSSTAPSLSLDFTRPGVLDPRVVFTRASTGTYFDSGGVMQTAAINAPRWDYDPVSLQLRGLLLEDQRTNGLRNSSNMSAVVPGTPGTPPAFWTFSPGSTGLSIDTVGSGVENGIAYVDVRYYGTTSASSFIITVADTPGANPAANGQSWTGSMYWRLAAGTLNGVTTSQIAIREATSASGLVKDNVFTVSNPNSGALRGQRVVASSALSGGGTVAQVQMRYYILINSGAVVDMTIRYGAPQTEQGDFATSFIPTTSVAVTRSIDSCLIPPANMSPWFASPGGSWFAEFDYLDSTPPGRMCVIGRPDAPGGRTPLAIAVATNLAQFDGVGQSTANTVVAGITQKGASTWDATGSKLCANGGAVSTTTLLTGGYAILGTGGVRFMTVGTTGAVDNTSGHIRRVQYYPRVLADAEMQSLTTITDPSLFLNFMNPGTLDPRIAFTRASTATYTDVNGVLQTANNDTPRWDYDPVTHALRGLLLEEARTNLLLQSGTGTTGWGQSNITKVVASGIAPDGTNTMVRQQEIASTSNHLSIGGLLTIVAATVYTFSVYAKAQENQYLQLVIDDNVSNGVDANFDLLAGTVSKAPAVSGSATNTAATIQAVGNGIYRCSITCATNSTTTGRPVIVLVSTPTAGKFQNYLGNTANGLLTWGAQFEAGAFPTSFILTTGSTVTRAADAMNTPVSSWFNSSGSTLSAEFFIPPETFPNLSSSVREACGLCDGTIANRLTLRALSANGASNGLFFSTTASVNSVSAPNPALTAGVAAKQIAAWNGTVGHGTVNGGTIISVNAGMPSGISLLVFGNNAPGQGGALGGALRAVRYWPRVLADAEMQQVTT